ncbi:uncharacterized protein BKA55DRAFT_548958 [Fusarium redolens]|uniref:Uncharacterized protein n=1 Tax=Fusarium redolens TaxID=48865 RepID=A0A9P9KW53_FUSRE|nr:uncharacterized protein BKA55DRAFT_548958 [Fusarium redolens]KAH7269561.1 hypothetical protein BKA55DRAFT_548958 [Fusarium redolens]
MNIKSPVNSGRFCTLTGFRAARSLANIPHSSSLWRDKLPLDTWLHSSLPSAANACAS